jgi:hypothetical protein
MRIIDKNTDFYDYLQNTYPDKSTTFDRTDSYLLTKDMMCGYLCDYWRNPREYEFILLQVCNSFWLFLAQVFREPDPMGSVYLRRITDYTPELLATWKNYDRKRELIKIDIVDFSLSVSSQYHSHNKGHWQFDRDLVFKVTPTLQRAIDTNDYRAIGSVKDCEVCLGNGQWVKKHIPILKASGLAPLIDPLEIYLSFDEFFSLEKSSTERIASVGITDVEKIENHGFDKKTSFRGKRRKT